MGKNSIYRIPVLSSVSGTHWGSGTYTPGGKGELLHLLVCLLELYFAGLNFRVLYTALVWLLWSKTDITSDYKSEKYAFAYIFFSALFRENQTSFHHFPCCLHREMFLYWWICGWLHLKGMPLGLIPSWPTPTHLARSFADVTSSTKNSLIYNSFPFNHLIPQPGTLSSIISRLP